MGHNDDLCCELRRHVKCLDDMMACCDRRIAADPPPFIRRRFFFARRTLGIARLAFLSILGLLGLAVV